MRFINLPAIARNSALILGLAVMSVLSINAQNSNTGSSSGQMANSTTSGSSSQMANNSTAGSSSQMANTTTGGMSNRMANSTPFPASTATSTPRVETTTTPRTEVKTVVEKENGFPWGLLGLLGLAGLIPKKRSVEVTGVRETARETRTTSDNRDNKTH